MDIKHLIKKELADLKLEPYQLTDDLKFLVPESCRLDDFMKHMASRLEESIGVKTELTGEYNEADDPEVRFVVTGKTLNLLRLKNLQERLEKELDTIEWLMSHNVKLNGNDTDTSRHKFMRAAVTMREIFENISEDDLLW